MAMRLDQNLRLTGLAKPLLVAFLTLPALPLSTLADDAADKIQTLEKLIETQNQKIEALTKKVELLEQRDQQRSNIIGHVQFPAIVIDTNGAVITPVTGPQ